MDLTTTYLGLKLKNPLVVSASPLSESLANIRRMEDNGAAAVVMQSLFEEQIEIESAALDRFLEGPQPGAADVQSDHAAHVDPDADARERARA